MRYMPPALTCARPKVRVLTLPLIVAALGWIECPIHAQTLTFIGSQPSVNFGSVNVCQAGASNPACFKVQQLTYKVSAGGALGTPKVLTLGSPNLDFVAAPGSSCTGAVTTGQTCTVQVKFNPLYAGGRRGGVELVDAAGHVLATTYLYGTGRGSQIQFDPTRPVYLYGGGYFGSPEVDGAGDVYLADSDQHIIKVPADGSAPAITSTGIDVGSAALDGVGNLYIGTGLNDVLEFPAGGGTPVKLPFNFDGDPAGSIAVDGAGDLFVVKEGTSSILKLPAGSSKQVVLDTASLDPSQSSDIRADVLGNLFISKFSGALLLLLHEGGGLVTVTPNFQPSYGQFGLDGVDDILNTKFDFGVLQFPLKGSPVVPLDLFSAYGSAFPAAANGPTDADVDGAGNLYISDLGVIPGSFQDGTRLLRYQRDEAPPVDFSKQLSNSTGVASFRIFNAGNVPLLAKPIFSSPAFQLRDTAPQNCLDGLASGAACVVNVSFSPTADGQQNGSMTLETNGVLNPVVSLLADTKGLAEPILSLPSGLYGGAQTVSISAPTPGAQIFYTTDGSLPTAASQPYTGPIAITASETVEAIAIAGSTRSQLALGVYTIASGSDLADHNQGFADGCNSGTFGGVVCAGSARGSGTRIRLTDQHAYEAGAMRGTMPVSRSGFQTNFTFQLTDAAADGFTFFLETDRPLKTGHTGKSLGYEGIGDSIALKFDLFNNAGEGRNSVGLFLDGAIPTTPAVDLSGTGIDLHSGDIMLARVSYDGQKLNLTLTDTASLATWSHAFPLDLSTAAGGSAPLYPGFTAGTGSENAIQDILSWSYISGPPSPLAPTPSVPASPAFPDGISPQGIRLNGSATIAGGVLSLTDGKTYEAGSAFYRKRVPINAFTTDFNFSIKNAAADGFTLTIQNNNPNALGGRGLDLGYGGIPKSVALKLDIFSNAGEGQDSTGVYLNGATPTVPSVSFFGSGIALQNEYVYLAHLVYDGTTLNVTFSDPITGAVWSHAFPVDIPAAVGGPTAYIGFTAGTGRLASTPQISQWTFSPQ